jgi:segregation and condensation protein A
MSYRVELPVFSGPMDLLLHLVKEQEVDVREVSIARILAEYLRHLEALRTLDLADIGEFVLMAGTLMELKSRELLPREEVQVEAELDPRDDLVRRLLDYKRYRDLSRKLDRLARLRSRKLSPTPPWPQELVDETEDRDLLDLGDADVWTLTAAFARLLEATGQDLRIDVSIDTRTVAYYTERVLARVRDGGEVRFEALFDPGEGRMGVIGTFIAVLEMMKQGFLRAWQDACFGPILIQFRGPPDLTADQVLARDAGDGA